MKLCVLPALLLALASSAHAGIATTVDIASATHWTANGGDNLPDAEVFTPFGGVLSSSLTPQRSCLDRYTKTSHISTCYFDSDQSGLHSPYESAYLSRLGLTKPSHQMLVVNLRVNKSGFYFADFSFDTEEYRSTDDVSGNYATGFTSSYSFQYSGLGMAWDTTMNAAFADSFWHGGRPVNMSFNTTWDKLLATDPLTGQKTSLASEGWDGEMKFRAVPEPAAPALFGIGLVTLAGLRRRKRD